MNFSKDSSIHSKFGCESATFCSFFLNFGARGISIITSHLCHSEVMLVIAANLICMGVEVS